MKKDKIFIPLSGGLHIKIVAPEDFNEDYLETLQDHGSLNYMGKQDKDYESDSLKNYIIDQYNSVESYLFGLYKDDYLMATSRVHTFSDQKTWQGILVFRKFRKQGKGQLLVKKVSDYILKSFNMCTLYAGILEENMGSQKIFSNAGFKYVMDDPDYLKRQIWVKESV